MLNSTYILYGYLNLFPGLTGFLYPVFKKHTTLYLADGNIYYIHSFHPLKPDYKQSVVPLPYTRTMQYIEWKYRFRTLYPHIYQKENGEICIGDAKQLYTQLIAYHPSNPVLQKELDDFLHESQTFIAFHKTIMKKSSRKMLRYGNYVKNCKELNKQYED